MTEQLLMWSAMSWSERNIYMTNCTFEELKTLRKELHNQGKLSYIWKGFLKQIDEEILKRLPGIREDKINEILK